MSAVTVRGLCKSFARTPALRPLDLHVPSGERLALLGPSGSGKSTLLRLIVGLDTPDAGTVHVGDADVTRLPPHLRGIGYVPQRPALYPHLTVRENLVEAARRFVPASDLSARITEAAELLHIPHLLARYPDQLSGGERQRCALARLAARRPSVWLLDEPFAPLDPMFRAEFRHDLHLLLERLTATMLLVTHDPIDALALGRRVGVLEDGTLRQIGTADELHARPANRFVAVALGRFSFIDGLVRGGDPTGVQFTSADGSVTVSVPQRIAARLPNPTDNLTLGIRPEAVIPHATSQGVALRGWQVISAEPVGSGWLLTVCRGTNRVRAVWPAGSPPPVGAPTDWTLAADQCDWFDGNGARIEG